MSRATGVITLLLFLFASDIKAAESYSLEQLDAAATLLVSASDANSPAKAPCKLAQSDAQALLQVIHPRIDEAVEKRAKKAVPKSVLQTCSRSCQCGLYASIAERRGEETLSSKLTGQARSESQNKTCLSQTKAWFCKSELLRDLRKSLASEGKLQQ